MQRNLRNSDWNGISDLRHRLSAIAADQSQHDGEKKLNSGITETKTFITPQGPEQY